MKYKINIKYSAEKSLSKLPNKIHDRIIDKIIELSERPRPRNSKKLESKEYYRISSGDYRILYVIKDKIKEIDIVAVDNRKDVYRNI